MLQSLQHYKRHSEAQVVLILITPTCQLIIMMVKLVKYAYSDVLKVNSNQLMDYIPNSRKKITLIFSLNCITFPLNHCFRAPYHNIHLAKHKRAVIQVINLSSEFQIFRTLTTNKSVFSECRATN